MQKVAIFDMDHTLLSVDCDYTWKRFAVNRHLANEDALAEADRFMAAYDAGTLDVAEFLRFQWREFIGKKAAEVESLCREHFTAEVLPFCRAGAKKEVERCREAGLKLWLLTSTCRFLAQPVADFFGIGNLFGAEIEVADGIVTGNVTGLYPCGENKVIAAREIADKELCTLAECRAYGDSINDLPLLKAAGQGFAVNPSPALARAAGENNLEILDWEK